LEELRELAQVCGCGRLAARCSPALQSRGLALAFSTLGPFFKASVTLLREPGSEPVGVLEVRRRPSLPCAAHRLSVAQGFVAPPPFGILHLDSVRVYNSRLRGAARAVQSTHGLAVLLGAAAFAHGHACGCRRAELLAINDLNEYAARLVVYYKRLGFVVEREIGDGGLDDLPHLLVWGGAGVLMSGSVEPMLRRWSRALRRSGGAPGGGGPGGGGPGGGGPPPPALRTG